MNARKEKKGQAMAGTPEDQRMRALAGQLRQPHGDDGAQVGRVMHESNAGMTHACFAGLKGGFDRQRGADAALLEIRHEEEVQSKTQAGATTRRPFTVVRATKAP